MKNFIENIKADLDIFSSELTMITVSRKDLERLVSEYEKTKEYKLKTITKDFKIGEFEEETLYCVKNGQKHIFSLENNSFSVSAVNPKQLENIMKYENGVLGQEPLKSKVTNLMKDMMNELSSIKTNELER